MSSTHGCRALTEITSELCRGCCKILGWYSDMPVDMWIAYGLIVEAAARGHLKCLQAALSAGPGQYACINEFDRIVPGDQPLFKCDYPFFYGPSALMAAAWNGHPRCVDLLLKEKFVIRTDEPDTMAPICLAADNCNRECFDLILKAHREERALGYAFCNAIYNGSENCVKMLIAAGIDVNQVNYYDETPLMCSNPADNAAITKALIEAGADPNIGSTEDEETALMIHIDEKSFHSVCLLLEAGADVNKTKWKNETPLMLLMHGSMTNKKTIAVALLLKGAKINILNDSGENPLTYILAYSTTHTDNIETLLYAAGEKIDRQLVKARGEQIPNHLQPQLNLMDICRRRIREHLLEVDPHTHLFSRVPKLEIPDTVHGYLLYDQTLNNDDYDATLFMLSESDTGLTDDDNDDDDDDDNEYDLSDVSCGQSRDEEEEDDDDDADSLCGDGWASDHEEREEEVDDDDDDDDDDNDSHDSICNVVNSNENNAL